MRNIKPYLIIAIFCFCINLAVSAQGEAKISVNELIYNFGTIEEADGPASHVFTVRNEGTEPLVITRITASCGCTQPEWSKEPIAPGKTSDIKVTFNPKGRPGPFYKTISIYSNAQKKSYSVGIKGTVNPKPLKPVFIYPYNIGDLKLTSKQVVFNSLKSNENGAEKINVINEGTTSITINVGKVPSYMSVNVSPSKIVPQETAEITVLLHAADIKKKGRLITEIPISLNVVGEKKPIESSLLLKANIVDDFDKLSSGDKEKAAKAELSGDGISFGKLPSKSSIMPFGGKVTGTIVVTNKGKSPLVIYSASCDDERVDVSGGKREIKPGASATFKVSLNPKDIKTKLEALVVFVMNDPSGPVRFVKVTAEK
jgi:hypothetical protein